MSASMPSHSVILHFKWQLNSIPVASKILKSQWKCDNVNIYNEDNDNHIKTVTWPACH